jgi:hypothetical protein
MPIDPEKWPEAETYFRLYSEGRYDDFAQLEFIYPISEARESDDGERLHIGRAGADGIEFAYRRGSPGIWAHYPIDGDLMWKADTIETFERIWKTGELKV